MADMRDKRKEELISRIKQQIAYAINNDECLNSASFGYEEGILLTVEEAMWLIEDDSHINPC